MTPENEPQVPVDPPSSSDPIAVADQAAPSVVPAAPPPASDAAQAGADVPPVEAPPGVDSGAAAQDLDLESLLSTTDPLIESRPLAAGEAPAAEAIDTPAKALAALGADAGLPAGTVDVVHPVSVDVPAAAHPADVIDALRAKLYAYGEECYNTVRTEVEYLIRLHPRL